jgi:hypothetical protein
MRKQPIFLKNYTSDVPVSESIRRIEEVLLRCGVKNIAKEYGLNQKIVAITFRVEEQSGRGWTIRLPADEQRATDALFLDYADGQPISKDGQRIEYWSGRKRKQRKDFVAQGERTAWRIVKDWVEVQMSMIQLKQADLMEVFLPYAYDGRRTYYQALKESNYAGLLPNE